MCLWGETAGDQSSSIFSPDWIVIRVRRSLMTHA